MEVTLYRYKVVGARWDSDDLSESDLELSVSSMISLPFQGEEEDRKFGIVQCGQVEDVIYGLFIQKFPTKLIDYDEETKNETFSDTRDSGEYLFVFFPKKYEIFIQAKRSSDLPSLEEVLGRLTSLLKLANTNTKLFFNDLAPTQDSFNRDKIVNIFYEEADEVTELDLQGFDPMLIREQHTARGRRQTYFNPREEFQEAMEEGALKFATHTGRIHIKSKQGEGFKKDPIARAMLEGSAEPTKIVYKKQQETKTEYGIVKQKVVLSISTPSYELDNNNQIENIIAALLDQDNVRHETRDSAEEDAQERLL